MRSPVTVLVWLITAVAVVFLLFTFVFPWFNERFVTDPVLEASPVGGETNVTEPFQPTPLGEGGGYDPGPS